MAASGRSRGLRTAFSIAQCELVGRPGFERLDELTTPDNSKGEE